MSERYAPFVERQIDSGPAASIRRLDRAYESVVNRFSDERGVPDGPWPSVRVVKTAEIDKAYQEVLESLASAHAFVPDERQKRLVKIAIAKRSANSEDLWPSEIAMDAVLVLGAFGQDFSLASERTSKKDLAAALHFFESVSVAPQRIARTIDEVNADTRVFVGPFEGVPDFFQRLPSSVERVWASLPGEGIRREFVEVGSVLKTMNQDNEFDYVDSHLRRLGKAGCKLAKGVRYMASSVDLAPPKSPERIDLVRLSVESMGFPDGATMETVFARSTELGLERCLPDVVPFYLFGHYLERTDSLSLVVVATELLDDLTSAYPGMLQVAYGDARPTISKLGFRDLREAVHPNREFLFRVRKVKES